MITGKTKLIGIFGYPVEHSLSPVMHNAAFKASHLDYAYIPLPTAPQDLKKAVEALKVFGFRGVNVTIPHKIEVMQYLDEINEDARMIGAVNTIICEEERMIGANTDAIGYIESLKKENVRIENANVVMLGAGGAARAVAWGLIKNQIHSLTILVRDSEKGKAFAARFTDHLAIEVYAFDAAEAKAALGQADIVINTTPLGMAPKIDAMPPIDWADVKSGAVASDLIYTPLVTKFLAKAKEHGHPIINGKEMLIEQGAESFYQWTGIQPDRSVMRDAFDEAWEKRN